MMEETNLTPAARSSTWTSIWASFVILTLDARADHDDRYAMSLTKDARVISATSNRAALDLLAGRVHELVTSADRKLGWSLVVGTLLALWSSMAGTKATVWLARGVDSWFGDRPFESGGRVSDGQLSLAVFQREGERPDLNVRLHARLRLPNLGESGFAFLGRDDPRAPGLHCLRSR